jgi:hypothetical protein
LAEYEALRSGMRDALKNTLAEYEALRSAMSDALKSIQADTANDADEDARAVESDDEGVNDKATSDENETA